MTEREYDDEAMLGEIESRMADFHQGRGSLIPILQMIQERCRYLSAGAIDIVARYLNISRCEVYGVATFYNQFRFHPPGKHQIKVCLGTACHVKGGDIILENFERRLGVKAGQTTGDREYSVDRVACVGCCALAPVTVIDDEVNAYVSPSKVEGYFLKREVELEKMRKEAKGGKDEQPDDGGGAGGQA